ncbi:AraC family transcriptional regulator [Paenibacillus polymyxa]|uniref:AraC family transcriptional regulator n=1 Tax=Paenibacillus amylolyticus TaxID=1451 RepID=UPI00105A118E|nr:AraC family transcriptional regulator [Paenibacillus amylolyticus]TDL68928.1 AraC family transcriptional regulator [Paenibacillus amylolyticus]UOK60883.1 AraC family transcriptional regulator [Paenibacillus sp. OVF10]
MNTHHEFGQLHPNRDCTIIYVGKLADNPHWSFPTHKHDDLHEIIYVTEGKGLFTIDGIKHWAQKGDMLIYNKGTLHEEKSNPEFPLSTFYCGFRFTEGTQTLQDWVIPPSNNPIIRANRYSDELHSLMQTLFNEFSIREHGYESISGHVLKAILLIIDRLSRQQLPSGETIGSNNLAESIKDYLDTHYRQNIKLKELADQFHIDFYYLIHMYKNHYGTSPYHYLIQRRMGEATRLLVSTNKKIWEIAKLVGYDNPNYFTILFTKTVGESPRSFRKKNQKDMFGDEASILTNLSKRKRRSI